MDVLDLNGAIDKLQTLLDTEIPKLSNVVGAAITGLGTVGGTLIAQAEVASREVIKDAFDRMDKLAARFSLPVRIDISKPE